MKPMPRKGTETCELIIVTVSSQMKPMPRKGTETSQSQKLKIFMISMKPMPRKGMET